MNPDHKLKEILQKKGYPAFESYEQAMTAFIKDRTVNGQYHQVFSSYVPEPVLEQEAAQQEHLEIEQQEPVKKSFFSRLFSKE